MTKVYELVYQYDYGYYHVAISLDKDKLQALIDKTRAFDEQVKAERARVEIMERELI